MNYHTISEGRCATAYKDVKSALEPYFHSCIVGMEACTSFYQTFRK